MPDFGFGYTEAGFLMTVFFTISGLGQAFAGILVNRHGARRVLMAGVGLLAASGVALAVAVNYPMLLLAVALAGMGNAVFHPSDFSLLNKKVSPPRLGYAFSVHGLSGNLGWAFGAAISGMALAAGNWRVPGVVAALLALSSVAALRLARPLLDDDMPKVGAGGTAAGGTFAFLDTPVIWLAFAFFLLDHGRVWRLAEFFRAGAGRHLRDFRGSRCRGTDGLFAGIRGRHGGGRLCRGAGACP